MLPILPLLLSLSPLPPNSHMRKKKKGEVSSFFSSFSFPPVELAREQSNSATRIVPVGEGEKILFQTHTLTHSSFPLYGRRKRKGFSCRLASGLKAVSRKREIFLP